MPENEDSGEHTEKYRNLENRTPHAIIHAIKHITKNTVRQLQRRYQPQFCRCKCTGTGGSFAPAAQKEQGPMFDTTPVTHRFRALPYRHLQMALLLLKE